MKLDLRKFGMGREALEYFETKDSFVDAWNDCHRGDWLLWIASKLEVDEKKMFLAKSECARTVIHLMKDERSIKAVDAARDYGLGKITISDLNAAFAAATAATAASAASDVVDYFSASNAAASATHVSASYDSYPAYAAANATYTAYVSASNADDAATYVFVTNVANVARLDNQKETAEICKRILSEEVFTKIKNYNP